MLSFSSEMFCDSQKTYSPENEIKPEVIAMLASWESRSADLKKNVGGDSVMVDAPFECVNERYKPCFYCITTEPPKRFYRTFWRSISRRALQHLSDKVLYSSSLILNND